MARILSDNFIRDFKEGLLFPVLKEVREEGMTLDFQIRNEEAHIYYRGGKILGVKPGQVPGQYVFFFDINYFLSGEEELLPKASIQSDTDVTAWIRKLPALKRAIDRYYGTKQEKSEREYQQVVTRENTYSAGANQTDYFIVDIEYQTSKGLENGKATKFDMLGILWLAEAATRKNAHKQRPRLAVFEMKYGDGALKGKSGLLEHVEKTLNFAMTDNGVQELKKEAVTLFQQKRELGLVRFGAKAQPGEILALSDDKPQFIFLLANHNPRSTVLKTELESEKFRTNHAALSEYMDIRFAVASFLGYGLYETCMLPLDAFMERLESQSA